MRNAEFNVAPEIIVEFVVELTNRNLDNSLIGITNEGDIIINVKYEKDESQDVDDLEEILEDLSARIEDEEDD